MNIFSNALQGCIKGFVKLRIVRKQLASEMKESKMYLTQVELKWAGEVLGNEDLRKMNRFYLAKIEGKTRKKEYSEAVLYFTVRRESGYYVYQVSTHIINFLTG